MTVRWWTVLMLGVALEAFAADPAPPPSSATAPTLAAAPKVALDPAPAKFASAVAYNDWIVERQSEVGNAIMAYSASFDQADPAKIEAARQALEDAARGARLRIETLPPFEGDTALRETALALFGFYIEAAAGPYKEIATLVSSIQSGGTPGGVEAALARMDAITADLTAREATFDANFQTAQNAFAAKHGFVLSDNALQKELDGLAKP